MSGDSLSGRSPRANCEEERNTIIRARAAGCEHVPIFQNAQNAQMRDSTGTEAVRRLSSRSNGVAAVEQRCTIFFFA